MNYLATWCELLYDISNQICIYTSNAVLSHCFFSFSQNLWTQTWIPWSDIPTLLFPFFNLFSSLTVFLSYSFYSFSQFFLTFFVLYACFPFYSKFLLQFFIIPFALTDIVLHTLCGVMFPAILLCSSKIVLSCLCAFTFFQLCLEVSKSGLLFRWSYMFCIFFHFWHFFFISWWISWFLSNSGCGSVSAVSGITSQKRFFGKGTRIKAVSEEELNCGHSLIPSRVSLLQCIFLHRLLFCSCLKLIVSCKICFGMPGKYMKTMWDMQIVCAAKILLSQ